MKNYSVRFSQETTVLAEDLPEAAEFMIRNGPYKGKVEVYDPKTGKWVNIYDLRLKGDTK